jgi:hypothetical protein
MSKAILSGHSKTTLPDLDRIARETQLVIRASPKFTPGEYKGTVLFIRIGGFRPRSQ